MMDPELKTTGPAGGPAGSIRRRTRIGDYQIHSVHAGAGPPLVLVHGLSGSHRWWLSVVPLLAARFDVHIPELLGFGASSAPRRHPGMPEMADILAEWIERLEVGRVHLVGHSMGGQVAIHLAARHPERLDRLVLTAAAGIPHPFTPREGWRLASEIVPPRAWGRVAFLPTIAADALRAGPRVIVAALRRILADDVRPLLPAITAPTLVIWGEHDPLLPLSDGETLATGIDGARLVVLTGASHNPMVDAPAAFARLLVDFLVGPEPKRPAGAAGPGTP